MGGEEKWLEYTSVVQVTKFCVEKFLTYYVGSVTAFSIEYRQAVEAIKRSTEIAFAYPVYFSNMPKNVYNFIINCNTLIFTEKNICDFNHGFIQWRWSGDEKNERTKPFACNSGREKNKRSIHMNCV